MARRRRAPRPSPRPRRCAPARRTRAPRPRPICSGAAICERGLDVVRVRPFNHTGAGQSDAFVASSFARQLVEIERGTRAGTHRGRQSRFGPGFPRRLGRGRGLRAPLRAGRSGGGLQRGERPGRERGGAARVPVRARRARPAHPGGRRALPADRPECRRCLAPARRHRLGAEGAARGDPRASARALARGAQRTREEGRPALAGRVLAAAHALAA